MQFRQFSSFVTLLAALAALPIAADAQTPDADASAAPSAAPEASAASETSGDQEAAALVSQLSVETPAATIDATQPSIRFYGFMDAGVQRVWGTMFDTGLGQSDAMNFVLGNVNLYIDATPAPDWRGLAEVRFTTFPNGAESLDAATGQFTRHSTTIFDYTASSGGLMTVDWGALILERAHIDWMPLDQFNIRVGYFLTPYGIFNVDHGSPTRIMLIAPVALTYGFLPERQTGIELFGLFHVARWELGYHLYVSNGRTTSVDFTDDKAVGGRLFFQLRRPVRLQVGASFYYGSAQTVEKSIGVNNGVAGIVRTTTVDLDEVAGAFDVSLDVDALRVRVEGAANQTIYAEGKRPVYGGAERANSTVMAVYGVIAYQLPWLGMEPALWGEWSYIPTPGIADEYLGVGVGLNFYITPSVIVRTQLAYSKDLEGAGITANMVGARLIITY